ncbi:MurR/RpiR family transcriptional regulator [Companilactobacillus allii]|uniref:Transcriptional regulator n=1 Tax=Companilactobacillus allii TaxID=1847728 RepID=A0A1P8Q1P9_9LACO|nr:MurR/RpiR family transcriptional regulator [Companilactobacillus allii]APX71804.1 transcriptional regulator [Companilactobacillus allii]USQ68891.1 MurR/RpiR family transcriptional regulator [Companilactobacillus allii]
MNNDFYKQIADKYDGLTANEQLVIDFILASNKPDQLKIKDISGKLFLSSATIVRASKKLGFKSFSQLKFYVSQFVNSKEEKLETENYDKIVDRMQSDFKKTIDMLSEKKISTFVSYINSARRIFCVGSGSSVSVSNDLNRKLKLLNYWSNDYEELYSIRDISDISSDKDVIIIISLGGGNGIVNQYLLEAKSKGTKVISITGTNASSVMKLSDANLLVYESPVPRKRMRSRLMLNVAADMVFEYIINYTYEKK